MGKTIAQIYMMKMMNFVKYQCLSGFEKCANNLQCIANSTICDGIYNCLDISDEQCEANCLRVSLGDKKAIIDKCVEDTDVCIPVDQYCDGVADCPDASDERRSDCSCEGWDLMTYYGSDIRMCLHPEWCLQSGINSTGIPVQCSSGISSSTAVESGGNLTGKSKM